jgi:hypothetical protein
MRRPEIGDARHLLLTTLELPWLDRDATLMAQQLCGTSKAGQNLKIRPAFAGTPAEAQLSEGRQANAGRGASHEGLRRPC